MVEDKMGTVVMVRCWEELPDTLEPGVYRVGDTEFTILEPVDKQFWIMAVNGVKRLANKYYK